MPISKNIPFFEVDASGLAVTVEVDDNNAEYDVIGSAAITVDNTFGHNGSLTHGLTYIWHYRAIVVYSGGVVRFHGEAMTETQALHPHDVVSKWDAEKAAWDVRFIPDVSEDEIIEGVKLADNTVEYDRIQEVSATDKVLGRESGGAGTIEEITCTAAGRALIDDASASDQRTTLGLGTVATQDAATVAITGGSITGITDLAVADGGTGASTAANARTNLGLTDGEWTPTLTSVANIGASTAFVCQYLRVGNRISFAGKITIDPTLAAPTTTQIRASLPVASNFASATDAAGVFHAVDLAGEGGGIYADTVNNELVFDYDAADTGSHDFYFSGVYKII